MGRAEEQTYLRDLQERIRQRAEGERAELDSLIRRHRLFERRWMLANGMLGLPVAILAAIAGAVASIPFPYHQLAATLAAALVAGLTAVSAFLNPKDVARAHKSASARLQEIRDELDLLVLRRPDDLDWLPELQRLMQKRNEVVSGSPVVVQ